MNIYNDLESKHCVYCSIIFTMTTIQTHNSKGDDLSQAFSGQDQCPSTSNTVWDTIVTVNFL